MSGRLIMPISDLKKYYLLILLFSIVGSLCVFDAHAAEDAEGFPIFYLRGSQTGQSWDADEDYRFSRSGNSYALHLDALDGDFKIADASWTGEYDFGAPVPKPQTYTISKSEVFKSLNKGGNLVADNLNDVTITFDFVKGALTMPVTVVVNGRKPEVPEPSGTLPVLYINVYTDESHAVLDNEIISKDLAHKDYFSFSEYWLELNGCTWMEAEGGTSIGSKEEPLPLEIKARGNWTRIGFAKKPFKLKLGSKQSMLGMTKSKHYAILAHADDTWGYLRNYIGFNLGKRIGLPWTPWQQPVEVVINGDYRGLYFLTESIRIGDGRIIAEELDDNVSDPALASGAYLVELDNYDEVNQIRMAEKTAPEANVPFTDMLRITWDTPEEYSELQRRFVTDQFSMMNDAIGDNDDKLWSYLDLDDAARYYIVEEILSHTEAYHGSTYLFRDRGEGCKWHFSPLWDFGNAFSGPTNDFFYRHGPYGNTWIPSMRVNDMFNDKICATWLWFMQNQYPGIIEDIDSYVDHIAEAAKSDHIRWADQPVPVGGIAVADNSDMASCRKRAVAHLTAKIAWLKGQFGDYAEGAHAEPARDATSAAPLPDYISASVDEILAEDAMPGQAVYYNLQGMRVGNPVPGQTYIRLRGSEAVKLNVRR